MLNKMKPIRIDEKPRFFHPQRRLTGSAALQAVRKDSEDNLLKNRIVELEEENARLRWTVKFLQDMNLSDE